MFIISETSAACFLPILTDFIEFHERVEMLSAHAQHGLLRHINTASHERRD